MRKSCACVTRWAVSGGDKPLLHALPGLLVSRLHLFEQAFRLCDVAELARKIHGYMNMHYTHVTLLEHYTLFLHIS